MTADPLGHVLRALERPRAPSSDHDLNPGTVLPEGRRLRPAGVLVPIEVVDGAARLWLTKRSSALKHHPGQVAFPGGKKEESDADITAAALREASEEIGLHPENVEVLGAWSSHETVTNFVMTPILGRVRRAFTPVAERGEVEEVFSVPLDHLLDAARFDIQYRRWRGDRRYYYTVPYGPYYIWGATARILRSLADAARS